MAITFRVGRYIDPSGFGLAAVDIPALEPEMNISLIDYSHRWEENVSSADSSVLGTYVDVGGYLPTSTVSEFLITNMATASVTDRSMKAPLYYRHQLRFYHFSYGQNPNKQLNITDQEDNVLSDVNYHVISERVIEDVYRISVLTDFYNNDFTQYKIKYNRCDSDGTGIQPGWSEILNAEPLFQQGATTDNVYYYSLSGPDVNGFYTTVVNPVPTMSKLTNGIGISFEKSPTFIDSYIGGSMSAYAIGVTVKYTLKATGTSTFSVKRDYNRNGYASNEYLQSLTADTWGVSAYNFTIGDVITALPGTKLTVHDDHYLIANDEAYFTASRSFFYFKPTSYRAIYLSKPEHVVQSDDWFMKVKNGRFRRRMSTSGDAVPSGSAGSILFEYSVPEYSYQMWDLVYGPPYKHVLEERAELIDKQTIQLRRTPLFVDPSSVLNHPTYPGFPASGNMQIIVNDEVVPQNEILDWDVYNGNVKITSMLTQRDDIKVSYTYKEEFFEYNGFVGSGTSFTPPYDFVSLDLNPTPSHNYGMYASGVVASIYLRPSVTIDDGPGGFGEPTTIAGDAIYHTYDGEPSRYAYASGIYDFLLGAVSLGPNCRVEDVAVTDVRLRGGGLSKDGIENIDKVLKVQPESEFFWDVGYFDGQAVPANGVLVVKIPKTVLTINGGTLGEDEVRQKVQKHMALGEFSIIEFV